MSAKATASGKGSEPASKTTRGMAGGGKRATCAWICVPATVARHAALLCETPPGQTVRRQ
ncbi:MAG: hypothetical protein AB7R89_16430 [Dehalococcoidia bacterium]